MTDTYSTLDSGMTAGSMHLSAADLSNLQTAGKWARFLGIVSFIGIGLMLLAGLGVMFGGAFIGDTIPGMPIGMGFLGIMYVVIAGLYLYPTYQLYQFGKAITDAARMSDGAAASAAFKALRQLLVFTGILTAIFLGIYAIMIIVGIVMGIVAG